MRFQKRDRHPFEDTRRKRLAAARRQQAQRDALPLLAPLIAETQPPIDQVMTNRAGSWAKSEQEGRDHRAAQWRQGRKRLDSYDHETRGALLGYWNGHRWLPGDPSYLLDMLHGFDKGRLILKAGKIESARVTISTAEATAAFGPSKPRAQGWLMTVRRP